MKKDWLRLILTVLLLVNFTLASVRPVAAQNVSLLPEPGMMVDVSPVFKPCLMRGVKYHPEDPFRFDFLIDSGDTGLSGPSLKDESTKLIKYLLASLTTPDLDLWVNLSPYEGERVIPDAFGRTEMGRDLLAQDYILKQVTSSLLFPEKALGKEFWARVYARAQELYGTTEVPVATFHKVWIVPDTADIVVRGNIAYVVKAHLKLMMEKDYLAESQAQATGHKTQSEVVSDDVSTQIMREVILPELEREVNEGKNFATVRQVYHALIVATWLKKRLTGSPSPLAQGYVDRQKTRGVEHGEEEAAQHIWQRYVESFRKGVFNFIKEEDNSKQGENLPRKYFSGGADLAQVAKVVHEVDAGKDVAALETKTTVVVTRLETVDDVMVEAASKIDPLLQLLGGGPSERREEYLVNEDMRQDIRETAKEFLDVMSPLADFIDYFLSLNVMSMSSEERTFFLQAILLGAGFSSLEDDARRDVFRTGLRLRQKYPELKRWVTPEFLFEEGALEQISSLHRRIMHRDNKAGNALANVLLSGYPGFVENNERLRMADVEVKNAWIGKLVMHVATFEKVLVEGGIKSVAWEQLLQSQQYFNARIRSFLEEMKTFDRDRLPVVFPKVLGGKVAVLDVLKIRDAAQTGAPGNVTEMSDNKGAVLVVPMRPEDRELVFALHRMVEDFYEKLKPAMMAGAELPSADRMRRLAHRAKISRTRLIKAFQRAPENLIAQALLRTLSWGTILKGGQETANNFNIINFLSSLAGQGGADPAVREVAFAQVRREFAALESDILPLLNGLIMEDQVRLIQYQDAVILDVDALVEKGRGYDAVVRLSPGDRAFVQEVLRILLSYRRILDEGSSQAPTTKQLVAIWDIVNQLKEKSSLTFGKPKSNELFNTLLRKQVGAMEFKEALIQRIGSGEAFLSVDREKKLDVSPWDIVQGASIIYTFFEMRLRAQPLSSEDFLGALEEESRRLSHAILLCEFVLTRGYVAYKETFGSNAKYVVISEMDAQVDRAEAAKTTGGIDLNTQRIKMQVDDRGTARGEGVSAALPMIDPSQIYGLTPVIVGIESMQTVGMILGVGVSDAAKAKM